MKRKFLALLLMLTLCLSLTACGGSAASGATAAEAAPQAMDSAADVEGAGFSYANAGGADFSAVRANAKLILSANVEAEATDFETTDGAIQQLTAQAGGYIESSAVGGSVGYRWANYTLRVPQEKFETFLSQIGDTCHVTYTNRETTDVTEQYYDTEVRLATQTTKQERLLALLEKADKMEDIIALESALADVNYEIETLTGSLRHYDNLVGFSTICLNLSEVRDLTAVQETPSFGSELKQAFLSGSRGFVNFLQNLLLLLAACWPFLVVLIAAVIAVLLLLRRRKIARRNALDAEINDQCDQNEKETK